MSEFSRLPRRLELRADVMPLWGWLAGWLVHLR